MKWKTDLEYKYISNQHMKLNRSSISYKLPYYYYFFFFLLVAPHSIQDLSSLTKNQTCVLFSGNSLNHWTTREVPVEVL